MSFMLWLDCKSTAKSLRHYKRSDVIMKTQMVTATHRLHVTLILELPVQSEILMRIDFMIINCSSLPQGLTRCQVFQGDIELTFLWFWNIPAVLHLVPLINSTVMVYHGQFRLPAKNITKSKAFLYVWVLCTFWRGHIHWSNVAQVPFIFLSCSDLAFPFL